MDKFSEKYVIFKLFLLDFYFYNFLFIYVLIYFCEKIKGMAFLISHAFCYTHDFNSIPGRPFIIKSLRTPASNIGVAAAPIIAALSVHNLSGGT